MVIIKKIIQQLFPKLNYTQRKGDNGKIGCLGGSFEYTGAPYYVAETLLKSGADLSYIFCPEEASIPIKAYSPDIIVIPYKEQLNNDLYNWLKSLYFLVIGPGLGRNSKINFNKLISDADFSWYLMKDKNMYKKQLQELDNIILTPNIIEFKRMYKHIFKKEFEFSILDDYLKEFNSSDEVVKLQQNQQIQELQKFFEYFENDNFYLLLKYKSDFIIGKNGHYIVQNQGGLKRCGGQGDILSALSALFCFWAQKNNIKIEEALASASYILRQTGKQSFNKYKLGLRASDMIQELSIVMNDFYDEIIKQQLNFNNDEIKIIKESFKIFIAQKIIFFTIQIYTKIIQLELK